jgi:hypothetical protein
MFHCTRGLFFTKRRWPFFFFFCRKGWSHSRRIYYFVSTRTWTTASIRNYGKTVRRVSPGCVCHPFRPASGYASATLYFFSTKKPFCNFILCTVIIYFCITCVQRKVFFGVKWGDTDSSGYREHNDLTLSGGFSYCRYCFVFAIYGFFIEDLKNSLIFLMASLRTERVTRHPA